MSQIPYLLARRRRIRVAVFAGLGLVALLVMLDHVGVFSPVTDDWAAFDGRRCQVVRGVSGDALVIRTREGGREATVHLLGVDASASPAAGDELAGRLRDRTPLLRLEPLQTRDARGRLLAYVYLNETEMLNLQLIREGQAKADGRIPHSFQAVFEQAQAEARKKRLGVWK